MKLVATPPALSQTTVDGRQYLLDGRILSWEGAVDSVVSSQSRRVLGEVAKMDADAAIAAVAAAHRAYGNGRGEWPGLHPSKRIACLERFVAVMQTKVAEMANLLCWEIAKPIGDSEKEITRTIQYIKDTILAYKTMEERSNDIVRADGFMAQIRRSPLGATLIMGPYNYPVNETFCVLIPALLMGNTVVLKGARFGALSLQVLLPAMRECFPSGVINTLNGDGRTVVGPIMKTGFIKALGFIGTANAARAIRAQHPRPNQLRCILGLEAKNFAIITSSAQVESAAKEFVSGALTYNGQRCTGLKGCFIHESVYEPFVKLVADGVSELKGGSPFNPASALTPMPHRSEVERLQGLLKKALSEGAKLVNEDGGRLVSIDGESDALLMVPAVIRDVTPAMEIARVEQFGPIVPLLRYRDSAEVIEHLDGLEVGQQVSVFSHNPQEVAKWVDACAHTQSRININTQCRRGPDSFPFTGRKDSAEGTLSVSDALRCFSIRAMASWVDNPDNGALMGAVLRSGESSFLSTDVIL
jgi:glyceraldehyde-3-phosphate dehydrogenase (NADP+)